MNKQKVTCPLLIILAVDGSEHSHAAVELLRDLPIGGPHPPESEVKNSITILTVLLPRDTSEYAARMALLGHTQNYLLQKDFIVNTELLTGQPAEMLVNYIEEHNPDLTVLGARGLRATLGFLLGGVAQQIVEYAHCPVLVVRAPYQGLKRILFVTDGSEYSQRATEYLACFPLPEGAEVTVAHVTPPISPPELIIRHYPVGADVYIPITTPEIEEAQAMQVEQEKQTGQTILDQAVASLTSSGIESNRVLLNGDPATEIIEYAKENQIDLIVCGSRGLSALKGFIMGSVSRKLVHYSGCSVLVVKGKLDPKGK